MNDSNTNKVDCIHCKHFAITWEPNKPKACKLFGFKSAYLPSSIVLRTTGSECAGFERKEPGKKSPS